MNTTRLEAFSDGVLAIIITIMVLEMKVPQNAALASLKPLVPVFLSYVLSFIYIGIYWNNHHHLLQVAQHVKGPILWANLHLLFWLSLIPFVTGWMGENNFAQWPVALYGMVLFFAGLAYYILERSLIAVHGKNAAITQALGKDFKAPLSMAMYALGVALAFVMPWIACGLYAFVAFLWLIPSRLIEKKVAAEEASPRKAKG